MVVFSPHRFRIAANKLFLFAFLAACLLAPLETKADQMLARENAIKAGFIYNIGKFILWPDKETGKLTGDIFCIRYTGAISMQQELEQLVGKKIKGAVIAVKEWDKNSFQPSCRILFVGKMPPDQLRLTLASAEQNNILTISDLPDFAKHGGMVNLYRKENRIALKINPKAMSRAGLQPSAKLLQLSTIVEEQN